MARPGVAIRKPQNRITTPVTRVTANARVLPEPAGQACRWPTAPACPTAMTTLPKARRRGETSVPRPGAGAASPEPPRRPQGAPDDDDRGDARADRGQDARERLEELLAFGQVVAGHRSPHAAPSPSPPPRSPRRPPGPSGSRRPAGAGPAGRWCRSPARARSGWRRRGRRCGRWVPSNRCASATQSAAEAIANMASATVQASSYGRRRTIHRSRTAQVKAAATSVAAAASAASRVTTAAQRRRSPSAPTGRPTGSSAGSSSSRPRLPAGHQARRDVRRCPSRAPGDIPVQKRPSGRP